MKHFTESVLSIKDSAHLVHKSAHLIDESVHLFTESVHKMRKRIPRWAKKTVLVMMLTVTMYTMTVFRTFMYSDARSLMCSFGEGRLGNQLSAFATVFAFSRKYGYRHVLLASQVNLFNYYFDPKISPAIDVLESGKLCVNLMNRWAQCRGLWESPWQEIHFKNDAFFNYDKVAEPRYFFGHALNIGDYPNQMKEFREFLPVLRDIFRFKGRFEQSAEEKIISAREYRAKVVGERVSQYIGVHIRHGDYSQHLKNIYKVNQVNQSYFIKAMDFFQDKFNNSAVFLVVTDDMEWAKLHLSRNDVVFAGNEKVLPKDLKKPFSYSDDIGEDLALLAACNHTIMTFGTFGLWGSLLAGGEVVLPKQILEVKEGLELKAAGMIGQTSEGWHLL